MQEQDTITLEQTYPSVELAYPLAVASYEVAQKRGEALDNKLQTLTAFIATTTLALAVLIVPRNLSLRSGWFVAAIIVALLAVVIGLYARFSGYLVTLDISALYNDYLGHSEWEFKKDFIYYAGINFDTNTALINKKGHCASIIAALFIIEAVLVLVWVVTAHS